jgi:hypothetical protein
MSKKRISFDVMDDGRLLPKFYKNDLAKMQDIVGLLNALPSDGMGQAKVAARALQNVLDGVYDAPEE